MESDSEGLIALARSFEGASVPSTVTLPTLVLEDQQRLEIDGLILLIHQFGPAEAIDSITIEVPANDASFVGDRPFYVPGPDDDLPRVLAQLQRARGGDYEVGGPEGIHELAAAFDEEPEGEEVPA
jgi:hypothetical protein